MLIRQLGRVDYLPTYEAMQAFTANRNPEFTKENVPYGSIYVDNQLWICEHPPVYTQGLAGKSEHVLNAGDIPVVYTNRGGQVTYHGPGQVVAYPLLDLKQAGYFVKEYVYRVEEAVIRTLAYFGVTGHRVRGAPGIYVRLDDPFSHAILEKKAGIPGLTSLPQTTIRGDPSAVASAQGMWMAGQAPNDNFFNGLGKIAALGIKVSRHCTYHGVALNVAMDLQPFSRINPCGYAGLVTTDLSTIGVSVSWQEAADVLGYKLMNHLEP